MKNQVDLSDELIGKTVTATYFDDYDLVLVFEDCYIALTSECRIGSDKITVWESRALDLGIVSQMELDESKAEKERLDALRAKLRVVNEEAEERASIARLKAKYKAS
jgi:hypothetical protein